MKFKCLLLIFAFTIILTDAAPTLKRDADAEAALAVKRDDSLEPWELIPLGKRDVDAEAALGKETMMIKNFLFEVN
ncbi:hypothetical protein RhiirA5_497474 [Rhizophagus irregularis]|uniref:Uncharacterized protein n=1 Tax=Rhizophagus irregularis TaxID=588596 RepID=A0A2I1DYN8_9GLOM|nr:hypothetical protein RhiirA5_497474 [Rhizophagus irregularis]PKC74905.1 hypothetical protein RhiirA1_529229 [Rhizophagus irregularis]PKY14988.1 hypothetical protein RhiirB3_427101 [Rhizophagus irregularis]